MFLDYSDFGGISKVMIRYLQILVVSHIILLSPGICYR